MRGYTPPGRACRQAGTLDLAPRRPMTGGPTGRTVRAGLRGRELANVVSPPHGDACPGQCRSPNGRRRPDAGAIPAVPAGTRGVELNRSLPGRRASPQTRVRRPWPARFRPGSPPRLARSARSPGQRSADSRRELPIARPFPSPHPETRRSHRIACHLDPRRPRAGERRRAVDRGRRSVRPVALPGAERVAGGERICVRVPERVVCAGRVPCAEREPVAVGEREPAG